MPEPRLRSGLLQALQQQVPAGTIVRRYRADTAPLVRNMNGSGRTAGSTPSCRATST